MARRPELLDMLSVDQPVSGEQLAERLNISRAAIWKQIEALRAAGLPIEARAGSGYLLQRRFDPLDPNAIGYALSLSARKRVGVLEVHWRLDSTSNEVSRRIAALPDRSFVFAEMQTAGRGRRGRAWLSPPGSNLYFSCLKRFEHGYTSLSGLSLAAGMAIVRALQDRSVHGVGLKWPNDLVHGDAKLAGILVELGGEFLGPCYAVIGVGINLHLPADTRAAIAQPITDIETISRTAAPARNALAAAIVVRLCEALDGFADHGFAAFADDYARYDALSDCALLVDDPRGAFEGVGAGVDARGALRVRTAQGERCIDSAEVSVRARVPRAGGAQARIKSGAGSAFARDAFKPLA